MTCEAFVAAPVDQGPSNAVLSVGALQLDWWQVVVLIFLIGPLPFREIRRMVQNLRAMSWAQILWAELPRGADDFYALDGSRSYRVQPL